MDFNEGFVQWSEHAVPENLRAKARFLRGDACKLQQVVTENCGDWVVGAKKVVICTGNTLGIMPEDVRSKVLRQMKHIAGDDGVVIVGYWNAHSFGHAVQHFYAAHPELCGPLEGAEYDWKNATMRTKQGYRTKWTTAAEAKRLLELEGFHVADVTETALGVLCTCTQASPDSECAETASKNYYDSEDSFLFYRSVWGGTHIHVGLYDCEEVQAITALRDKVSVASEKSMQRLFDKVPVQLDASSRVMDMGAAFGGTARYVAQRFGSKVWCIELSERENEVNAQETQRAGLSHLVNIPGPRSFTNTLEEANSFDLITSQDSFLHAGNARRDIFPEAARLLKQGGYMIFTDIMQIDNIDSTVLAPVYQRIKLQDMGSVEQYKQWAQEAGLTFVEYEDHTSNLAAHYGLILQILSSCDDLSTKLSRAFLQGMKAGLNVWVEHANAGHLQWGYLVFRKDTV